MQGIFFILKGTQHIYQNVEATHFRQENVLHMHRTLLDFV